MPAFGIFGQNMRFFERIHIGLTVLAPFVVADNRSVAAVAIHAAQNHSRGLVHGLLVAVGVTGLAAAAFGLRLVPGLVLRGRGREAVIDLLRFFLARSEQQRCRGDGQRQGAQSCQDQFAIADHEVPPAHQKASIALSSME